MSCRSFTNVDLLTLLLDANIRKFTDECQAEMFYSAGYEREKKSCVWMKRVEWINMCMNDEEVEERGNLLRMLEFFAVEKWSEECEGEEDGWRHDSHIFSIGEDGVFMRDALL